MHIFGKRSLHREGNVVITPPPRDIKRWSPRRKEHVVRSIQNGLITFADACERYDLSAEELRLWIDSIDKHGRKGVSIPFIQKDRK